MRTGRLTGRKTDLYSEIGLVGQLTGKAVRRKLAGHVQTVLDEVRGELVVQRLLPGDLV